MAAREARGGGDARFVAGAGDIEHVPHLGVPEVALAGRSNVGKSSLLNRLTGRRALARVSKTPGRTQQINFFLLAEDGPAIADLPGYGFARVPLPVRAQWKALVEGYLRERATLRGVFVLVDARRGVGEPDLQLFEFLAACRRPAGAVLTKIDKLSRSERARVRDDVARRLGGAPFACLPCSATTGEGIDDVRGAILAACG